MHGIFAMRTLHAKCSCQHPDMKPTLTNSVNLMLEDYIEPRGLVFVGAFCKVMAVYRYVQPLTMLPVFQLKEALL